MLAGDGADRGLQPECRPGGAKSVIGLAKRGIPDRHHGVPGELDDRAALAEDRGHRRLEVPVEQGDHGRRVGPLGVRREALKIGKQHRHLHDLATEVRPALLPEKGRGHIRRKVLVEEPVHLCVQGPDQSALGILPALRALEDVGAPAGDDDRGRDEEQAEREPGRAGGDPHDPERGDVDRGDQRRQGELETQDDKGEDADQHQAGSA